MKAPLLLLFFYLATSLVSAQSRTILGFDMGLKGALYHKVDPGGMLETPLVNNPTGGINIAQEFKDRLRIETGVYLAPYYVGYWYKHKSGAYTNSIRAFQIPLRIKTRFNIVKNKFFIGGTIGYSLMKNLDFKAGAGYSKHGGGTIIDDNIKVTFADSSNSNLAKRYSLLETGLFLEYNLFKGVWLTLSGSYYTGFKPIITMDVAYTYGSQPTQHSTLFSNGDFLSITFGVKYEISSIFKKREKNS